MATPRKPAAKTAKPPKVKRNAFGVVITPEDEAREAGQRKSLRDQLAKTAGKGAVQQSTGRQDTDAARRAGYKK
jgi:hypothetical protein